MPQPFGLFKLLFTLQSFSITKFLGKVDHIHCGGFHVYKTKQAGAELCQAQGQFGLVCFVLV